MLGLTAYKQNENEHVAFKASDDAVKQSVSSPVLNNSDSIQNANPSPALNNENHITTAKYPKVP